jgi:hypothetical protein
VQDLTLIKKRKRLIIEKSDFSGYYVFEKVGGSQGTTGRVD